MLSSKALHPVQFFFCDTITYSGSDAAAIFIPLEFLGRFQIAAASRSLNPTGRRPVVNLNNLGQPRGQLAIECRFRRHEVTEVIAACQVDQIMI